MKVFIIAAISVDGFIAPSVDTSSVEWTSKGDKQFFTERTKQAKVMVMGRTTFETIGRALPGRKIIVMSSKPKPEEYAAIPDSEVKYTPQTPSNILDELETAGHKEVAICGGSQIYFAFMEAGLVDTLYLTVEPITFGKGIGLFKKELPQTKLELQEMKKIDEHTVLLEYLVIKA